MPSKDAMAIAEKWLEPYNPKGKQREALAMMIDEGVKPLVEAVDMSHRQLDQIVGVNGKCPSYAMLPIADARDANAKALKGWEVN